jgi:hypothetical protein
VRRQRPLGHRWPGRSFFDDDFNFNFNFNVDFDVDLDSNFNVDFDVDFDDALFEACEHCPSGGKRKLPDGSGNHGHMDGPRDLVQVSVARVHEHRNLPGHHRRDEQRLSSSTVVPIPEAHRARQGDERHGIGRRRGRADLSPTLARANDRDGPE